MYDYRNSCVVFKVHTHKQTNKQTTATRTYYYVYCKGHKTDVPPLFLLHIYSCCLIHLFFLLVVLAIVRMLSYSHGSPFFAQFLVVHFTRSCQEYTHSHTYTLANQPATFQNHSINGSWAHPNGHPGKREVHTLRRREGNSFSVCPMMPFLTFKTSISAPQ